MGLAVAIAVAASITLTPLARRLAWKCNAVSRPDGQRRRQAQPTAVWGGVAVFLAVLAGIAVVCIESRASMPWCMALSTSAAALCVLGCYDDLVALRARWKLLGQILSTLPIVLCGEYVEDVALGSHSIHLGVWGAIGTVGWLILGINALNLIDGMDGLASLIGIVTSAAIAVIAISLGLEPVALVAMSLAGALLGFIIFNLPPAKIYLGDCGSMVIGLLLAAMALRLSPRAGTADLTAMVGLLFVPLLDTSLAVVRRTIWRRGIMVADRGHVHHRLLDRGFTIWTVLGILGGLALASATAAWLAAIWEYDLAAWAMLTVGTAWCIRSRLAGHEEWAMAFALVRGTGVRTDPSARPSVYAGANDPYTVTLSVPGIAKGPHHRTRNGSSRSSKRTVIAATEAARTGRSGHPVKELLS